MKRPLFLVLAALVSGEVAAANFKAKGFFVIFLVASGLAILGSLRAFRKKISPGRACLWGNLRDRDEKKRRRHFIFGSLLFLLFFGVGGILFFQALKEDAIDRKLARDSSLAGNVRGKVDSVKKTSDGEYQLTLTDVRFGMSGEKSLRGRCRVLKIPLSVGEIYPGDEVSCAGTLKAMDEATNPGQFPSKIYYYSMGIRYQFFGEEISRSVEHPFSVKRWAYLLKRKISSIYGRVLASQEEALLNAIVLGDKTDLLREQKLLYEENGVAHLLAVSGLHVSIVGGSIFRLLRKRGAGYGVSCLGGGAMLFFYAILTGFGNSVFRATLMFGAFLLSQYTGAEYDMVSSMSLAGILMLFDSPWRLFEGGCIISFLSVATIGYLLPWVKEKLDVRRKRELSKGELSPGTPWQKKIREAFTASLVISMATGPLLLRFYYQWSPYSILLNLIVVPAMTPLMLSALSGGVLGIFGDFPAFIGCLPAFLILRFFNSLFSLVEKIPGSLVVTGCPSWPVIFGLYLLEIVLAVLWFHRLWRSAVGMVLTLAACLLLLPEPSLRITMLDVGQGECIFIKLPSGENLLIDGGSTSKEKLADYTMVPAFKYYGAASLDYVAITHTDEDHISGIEELLSENYPIKVLLLPDIAENEDVKEDYDRLETLAKRNGTKILRIAEGDGLSFGNVRLFCLHPEAGRADEDKNSSSVVLYLQYGSFDALFTGDLGGEQEELLWERFRQRFGSAFDGKSLKGSEKDTERKGICLLKTAHHGSKYSTTAEFLEKFRPENAIISAGKNNWYGHPHDDTLQRLKSAGAKSFATLWGGAIVAESDGETYEIGYFH